MTFQHIILGLVVISMISIAYAESPISIILGESEYTYCQTLFYSIVVDDVTLPNESATIHIIDANSVSSSPIPIMITNTTTHVPALVPFEDPPFGPGRYTITAEYMDNKTSVEFELVKSDSMCISSSIRPILGAWVRGEFSDGFVMDALQKHVDDTIIDIPFSIDKNNFYDIHIPDWVRTPVYWWLSGAINDDQLIAMLQYLIDESIITIKET